MSFEAVSVASSPAPPDMNHVIFVRDCQLLDLLLNSVFPLVMFAWIGSLICRSRQAETKPAHAVLLDDKNTVKS